MRQSVGVKTAPDAVLRTLFNRSGGAPVRCPKCRTRTLDPGRLGRDGLWLCIPCNGFFAPAASVMPFPAGDPFSPHFFGFDEAEFLPDPFVRAFQWLWRRVVAIWLGVE